MKETTKIMADKTHRFSENVPGAYYVTEDCIDCDMCRVAAPLVFHRDESLGFSVVYRQPVTEEERTQADEALESCPVEAIGSDG